MTEDIKAQQPNNPSSSPSTKNKLIQNLIEIATKEHIYNSSLPDIEKFVEELFYHISKYSDEDLTFGKIGFVAKEEILSGEYQIELNEVDYFNNLVKVLNRLFRISRGTL